jgi:signal transduction histidine kinase
VNQKDFWQWAGIDIDPRGRIWMGTHPTGIIIYDPANNSVHLPFPNDSVQQENVSGNNVSLYCDRNGMAWSGYFLRKGIYQLIPFSPAAKHYTADAGQVNGLHSNAVSNFINAGHGTLWMGSPDGINIFNPHTGFFNLVQVKDLPGIKRGRALFPVNIDTINKKAWIFNFDEWELFEMDLPSRKCRLVMYEDSNGHKVALKSVLAHHPQNMFARNYKNGCLIAASLPGHQEILIANNDDPAAQKILSFAGEPIDVSGVFTNEDNLLFLRRPNASTNLTYVYQGNRWVSTPSPLDSIRWSWIYYNKTDRTYWIIAETQLTQYDYNFRVLRHYNNDNGMPGVKIHGLIHDTKGNIWFNTDRSIFQLNTKTGTITMLAEKDGFFPQNLSEFSRTKDDYGNLYIATEGEGFYQISPDKYVFSASSVYFESLKINQQNFSLSTGPNHTGELSLKYFENNIVIETGTIDYYSKGKGHIRYKLEADGKPATWQYAPAYYTIRYEGLPPGKYRLILQSSNAANEFNGPEKTLLINITPPFWQTWWFRILAALVVAGAIYGWVRYRSNDLNKRNVLLEKKVTERTNELNNSLSTLKNTQDQLVHSEKMASLGELTSGIAHEIKNPLNFINNFSELNLDLISEMENQPNKDPEAAQFLKTLKKNSEKINHHGKRVDDIVKSMLQHSRIGNLTKEPVNVNVLCEESLKLAYHGFKAKEKTFQASFETRFDPALPQIMAVPQDLSRVLLNLFNNAFYAVYDKKKKMQPVLTTGAESDRSYIPKVTVGTKKCDGKIAITVSDNGMGINHKIINKIFQPFFTTKPAGEGTGLGLSMSYDIIAKSHGGELNVKSIEGEGTDFEIILPVQ